MSHYVYRNLHATEISKLQLLIIALFVIYIWLIVFIPMTSYTLSWLRLSHFMMKKDWH